MLDSYQFIIQPNIYAKLFLIQYIIILGSTTQITLIVKEHLDSERTSLERKHFDVYLPNDLTLHIWTSAHCLFMIVST